MDHRRDVRHRWWCRRARRLILRIGSSDVRVVPHDRATAVVARPGGSVSEGDVETGSVQAEPGDPAHRGRQADSPTEVPPRGLEGRPRPGSCRDQGRPRDAARRRCRVLRVAPFHSRSHRSALAVWARRRDFDRARAGVGRAGGAPQEVRAVVSTQMTDIASELVGRRVLRCPDRCGRRAVVGVCRHRTPHGCDQHRLRRGRDPQLRPPPAGSPCC